jgi:hypothetical protein
MKKIMFVFIICASLFMTTTAQAGVEASPFKEFVSSQINIVVERLMKGPLVDDPEVQALANEVLTVLQSVDVNHITRQGIATKSIIIMERISSALSDAQAAGYQSQALKTLSRLTKVGFDPQFAPPGLAEKCLNVLDRISAAGFDPQAEQPVRAQKIAGMEALDRISAIGFDQRPEPSAGGLQIMDVFDIATLIEFDPQPEPPGLAIEMFGILNLLRTFATPGGTF